MNTVISRRAAIVAACLTGFAWVGVAQAAPQSFKVKLSGSESVPPVETAGTGTADLTYDPATRNRHLGHHLQRPVESRPPWRISTDRPRRARTARSLSG